MIDDGMLDSVTLDLTSQGISAIPGGIPYSWIPDTNGAQQMTDNETERVSTLASTERNKSYAHAGFASLN
jgi:hypothetical protein